VRLGRPGIRLRAVLVVVVLVLALMAGRLVQLQGVQAAAYSRQVTAQEVRTVPLLASRGTITDAGGHVLAEDVPSCTVTADPRLVGDAAAEARDLAPLLHLPAATVLSRLEVSGAYSLLAQGLTPGQGQRITGGGFAGIYVQDALTRVYPDGNLAGAVVGFTGEQGSGLSGVEYAENAELTGRSGELTMAVDPSGEEIPTAEHKEVPAVPGDTVALTLNSAIQWYAQSAITAQVKATGAQDGTVVVENPRTGAILALATAPGFDPAEPDAGSSLERAVSDVYEPGSVNKVITAAGALQDGVVTPTTTITVPPEIMVAGTVFHDAEVHPTEHLTFTGVLAQSSNIGTIEVSQRLGAHRLYHYLRAFGLGSPTGVGIPGESGGILAPLSQWSGTQYATIPFGQGMSVTALQVAEVYSTIADGGLRVQPHIVAGISAPGGSVHAPRLAKRFRVVSPHTAATLREMLESVTTDLGTAPAAAIPGYRVAGKTGTANSVGPNGRYDGGYTASFVGMAPANDPKLVVEVVLENPKVGIYGGTVSAPVFRQVMGFALQTLHIPPTTGHAPQFPIYAAG
jgi:cell division protein FtsI (penicillin-binding protein 3)